MLDLDDYTSDEIKLLSECTLCPRNCHKNRLKTSDGFCHTDAGFYVSSICAHKGEEPVISGSKGICNVFFPHCNLQCIYCQNRDISFNGLSMQTWQYRLDQLVKKICQVLEYTENVVGFVSPSHFIPQMMAIIRQLHKMGKHPVIVYNSNAYDKVSTLKMLEGIVDVYLPDMKYADSSLAYRLSGARNYPETALAAIQEMKRQKGTNIRLDKNGLIESGLIIRHLLLPDASAHSIEVLKVIAEEISDRCYISLMAQYFPTPEVCHLPELNKTLTSETYQQVVESFYNLGFERGWVQELTSQQYYRPDFTLENPFD